MPSRGRLKAIEPEHVTAVLRRSGALEGGRVTRVETETLPTLISRVLRLRLRYEGGSGGPASIIFKSDIPYRTIGLWEAVLPKSGSTASWPQHSRRPWRRAASKP